MQDSASAPAQQDDMERQKHDIQKKGKIKNKNHQQQQKITFTNGDKNCTTNSGKNEDKTRNYEIKWICERNKKKRFFKVFH